MSTKMIRNVLVAALALMGLFAGEAFAQAASATVTVSAVVPKACRFYTASTTMTIAHGGGLIDPSAAGNATGSATLNYRCQATVSPEFDIDTSGTYASPKTATVNLAGTATNLAADITVTATGGAGTGLGAGQDKIATISGLITPANFSVAAPDTYSKVVTIGIQAIP
jgi:hypothetical protein